ncbi:MAG: peptidase M4 [Acidobacteria bacterium]|nr:peptidase M4 [Acidobacteriota bacterium]
MSDPAPPPVATTPAAAAVAQTAGSPVATHASVSPAVSLCAIDPSIDFIADAKPFRRRDDDPLYRPLRIYSRDPAGSRVRGNEVEVRVPWEPLKPGPIGSMLGVETDWPDGTRFRPADLEDRHLLLSRGLPPSATDPRFHAQMVYAVARLTYATFQTALGRDPTWSFADSVTGKHRLTLRPFASEEQNSFYDRDRGEVRFGFFKVTEEPRGRSFSGGYVFTSLSHDVIVHEVTHALLDGLRARFRIPTRRDVLGFHEGFADLVAIFQRFTYRELVRETLRKAGGSLHRAHVLFEVAREFGQTTGREGALRSAIEPPETLTTLDDVGNEPHEVGMVLVSAAFEAFDTIYQRKIARILRVATGRSVPPEDFEPLGDLLDLLAGEASRLAGQFLNLIIRAVDYCPPVDLSLGEYLRALITADRELVPDDPWAYREAWIDSFARRHIVPQGVPTLTEDALLWTRPRGGPLAIERLAFADLKFSGDPARPAHSAELRRQAAALGDFVSASDRFGDFGLALPGRLSERPMIHSVRTSRRIGPDGQVLFDLVAEITQRHLLPSDSGEVPFFSGSTVVIGPEGEVRYVIRKGPPDELSSRQAGLA